MRISDWSSDVCSSDLIDEWNRRRGDDQVPSGYIDILRIAPDGSLWLSSQGGGIQQRDVASGAVLRTWPAGGDSAVGSGETEAMAFDADGRQIGRAHV